MGVIRELIILALSGLALGPPLIILVKSGLDLRLSRTGRGKIFLEGVVALAIWAGLFWFTCLMFYTWFSAGIYHAYKLPHPAAPDPAAPYDPTPSIIVLVVAYVVVCSGLSYRMLRRAMSQA